MSKPLKKGATYADLEAVADNFVAEILAGELYASPRPTFSRMRAAATLGVLLGAAFELRINGPGVWLCVSPRQRRQLGDIAGTWRTHELLEIALAEQDRVDEHLWPCGSVARRQTRSSRASPSGSTRSRAR